MAHSAGPPRAILICDDGRMTAQAHTHRLGGVTVHAIAVSPQDNNCYLITAPGGEQLLVDAADDAPAILAMLEASDAGPLRTIVTTHQHWDHHRALIEVAATTGATTMAGEEDADALPLAPDRRLRHGDVIDVDAAGTVQLEVIALRGHTPGSVALVLREPVGGEEPGRVHLFAGDSLFPGGPGRTTSPADFDSLMTDLENRVFGAFGDATVVYPGHGSGTTLGAERPQLPEWRARGW